MTKARFKRTKIVATLGPACNSKTKLKNLIRAGVNVFRINFSHATYDEVDHYIEIIKELNKELDSNVAVLADLQGPKIRLGNMYPNVSIKQRTGDELKVVYCGQDLALYDDLKKGFNHLYIQPCYIEDESIEENGKSFQIVERLVKDSPEWRLSLQTQKWMGVL